MSYVTNILLTFSVREILGIKKGDVPAALVPIQAYLAHNSLNDVGRYAGGPKFIEHEVWATAANYLNIPEFISVVSSAPFKRRECVQIFICDQNDSRFSLFSLNEQSDLPSDLIP